MSRSKARESLQLTEKNRKPDRLWNLYLKYGYTPDAEEISKSLDVIAANIDNMASDDVLIACLSMMDLTTLRTEDTPASVEKLVGKVNSFLKE